MRLIYSLPLILASCAAAVPTPSMPCPGLYCLQWSGPPVGIPLDALICAKTEAQARALAQPLLDRHPDGSFRLVPQ
jgi:hypothetical protein